MSTYANSSVHFSLPWVIFKKYFLSFLNGNEPCKQTWEWWSIPNNQLNAHPAAHFKTWVKNRSRKLPGQNTVMETAYQLLSWPKQSCLGRKKNKILPSEIDLGHDKQNQSLKNIFLPCFFQAQLLSCRLLYQTPTYPEWQIGVGSWGVESVHSSSSLLLLSPYTFPLLLHRSSRGCR